MKGEADNEKLLIRYLLGNLPEEHRLQVEGEFLSEETGDYYYLSIRRK
jgi:hypothetical protein